MLSAVRRCQVMAPPKSAAIFGIFLALCVVAAVASPAEAAPSANAADVLRSQYVSRDSTAPYGATAGGAYAQRQMVQDSLTASNQASAYQKDALYSPYVMDVFKQMHNSVEHNSYLSADRAAPGAAERDALALNRDVTIDKSLHAMGASDDVNGAAGDLNADVSSVSSKDYDAAKYEGDYAPYPAAYQRVAAMPGVPVAAYARSPAATFEQRYGGPNVSPQCNPCGPPPCPNPCPPPPSPLAAPPVASAGPCVMEIPLCIQYLINIVVIGAGLAILKWYCSTMSELDRECGLDDRAQGGKDSLLGRRLSTKKSSFSPPMATISAYYDPMTNQVLLPQNRAQQHYQFNN